MRQQHGGSLERILDGVGTLLKSRTSNRRRLGRALRVGARSTCVLAVFLCTTLALAVAHAHRRGPARWTGWDVARRNVYCEEVRWDEGVRQPVNTLSNLPFVLTGAHMLVLGATDTRAAREGRACAAADRSMLQHFPLFTFANGAAQLWVAAGSLLFHGSWTRAGQRVDMGAVYAALLCPAVYVAQRVGLLGPGGAHSSFATVLLAACIWFTANKWRVKSATMVPALIVLLVGLLLLWFAVGSPVADGGSVRRWLLGPVQRRRPDGLTWELLVGAALSIALAFACTALDMSRRACAPRGWFQWHAVWHLAAALSLWLLYAFFRSECPPEDEGGELTRPRSPSSCADAT